MKVIRLLLIVCVWTMIVTQTLAYDSVNVLSNGGFENGDLTESANNVMGSYPWFTSNSGGNAIAVTGEQTRSGSYSLMWSPIGWNVKEDKTLEDASTFMLTSVRDYTAKGATAARLSGFVNTSALKPKFRVQVILANDSFSRYNVDTVIAGGLPGWHRFEASMPLTTSDNAMFIAFTVKETKGVGAPKSKVYIDDLELVYSGIDVTEEMRAEKNVAIRTTKYVGYPITDHPANDEDVHFIQAQNGAIYFLWASERGGSSDIWAKKSMDGIEWSEPWQITFTDVQTWGPTIGQDANGTFHMVYSRIDMPNWNWDYLHRRSKDMVHWDKPRTIVDHPSQNWGGGLVVKGNDLWVLFGSDRTGNMDLFIIHSTDHGETWTKPVQLTTNPMNDDIAFFAYLDDQFIASWVQTDPKDTYEPAFLSKKTEIFFMTSPDGVHWSDPIQVTNDTPDKQYVDTIASLNPGKNGAEIIWVGMKWDGSVAVPIADPDLKNIRRLEGVGFQPSKIALQNGKYLMGWPVKNEKGDGYEIYAQIVDD